MARVPLILLGLCLLAVSLPRASGCMAADEMAMAASNGYVRPVVILHAQMHFALFQASADVNADQATKEMYAQKIDAARYEYAAEQERYHILCGQ
jgi:hypothetical protein